MVLNLKRVLMLMMMMMMMMIAMLMKIQPLNARTLRDPESKPQHFTGNCSLASLVRRSGCGAQTHTSAEGHESKRYCSWDQHQKLSADPKTLYIRIKKPVIGIEEEEEKEVVVVVVHGICYISACSPSFIQDHLGLHVGSHLGFHLGFHSGFHLGAHLGLYSGLHVGFHLEGFIEGYI